MPIGAVIGSVVGGVASMSAASKAAKAQTNAARSQAEVQKYAYDTTRADLDPFKQSGTNALGAINYEMGLGAKPADYVGFQKTPGYDFQFQQGVNAIDRSAAASGGLFSGQTGKALTTFGQGVANQEYGNYFNRLMGLTNMGQNAAAQTGQAAQNYANGASNAYANIGNAQAAGAIGQANALNGGIQNALGVWQYQNQIAKPNTSGIGWSGWGLG